MAGTIVFVIIFSLFGCASARAQTSEAPARETFEFDNTRITAPSDSKVTKIAGGVNQVESNKEYTLRKIREIESRLAKLEEAQTQTTATLAQIQESITAIQAALDKPKTDSPIAAATKQPVEAVKKTPSRGTITVRRLDN